MKELLILFSLQFLSYLNITLDMRAIANEQYLVAAVTNLIAPVIAWVMIKRISKSNTGGWGILAVALGGAVSTMCGIWLTRAW